MLKKSANGADDFTVMADVQFAPPLQRLTSPPKVASTPPPPPPLPTPAFATPAVEASTAPPPATPPPSLRLSAPVPQIRETSASGPSLQELLMPNKGEERSASQPKWKTAQQKKKKKRGKKLLVAVVLFGMIGGSAYGLRNTAAMQKLLGNESVPERLPEIPFARPPINSVQYSVTLSSVQNGVPNNVTTTVQEDFTLVLGQSTIETQTGAVSTTTQELRTAEFIFRPGQALGVEWTRQPHVPESPSPYDVPTFIPMIDDIIDQPLRKAMEPVSWNTTVVDGVKLMSRTYVIDRARVPYIAKAIWARVPWLFDVPNASNMTVEVTYDENGLVRHLFIGVDPPQPGTGIDATWVTSYSLDVTTLNAPVTITIPAEALDVPAGTP
jgi:hypothetical protein